MKFRINKLLVAARRAPSRRKADDLIASHGVVINGKKIFTPGVVIDAEKDEVVFQNTNVHVASEKQKIYLVNKPAGYVCSKRAGKTEKSIYQLVPHSDHLAIAGRLDKASRGLVIMTSDGALIYELTHPSFGHKKIYEVTTEQPLQPQDRGRLIKGVRLDEGLASFDEIRKLTNTRYTITIHQGWKSQIRRMFDAIGTRVVDLQRLQVGPYTLGTLKEGAYVIREDSRLYCTTL